MKEKLRVGILIENDTIPAWLHKMLTEIDNSFSSKIVLIVKNGTKKANKEIENQNRKYFVYNLYRKLDRNIFKQNPDAFESKDLNFLLNADKIELSSINNKNRNHENQ